MSLIDSLDDVQHRPLLYLVSMFCLGLEYAIFLFHLRFWVLLFNKHALEYLLYVVLDLGHIDVLQLDLQVPLYGLLLVLTSCIIALEQLGNAAIVGASFEVGLYVLNVLLQHDLTIDELLVCALGVKYVINSLEHEVLPAAFDFLLDPVHHVVNEGMLFDVGCGLCQLFLHFRHQGAL